MTTQGNRAAAEIGVTDTFHPAVHGVIEAAADELFREFFGELPWDETVTVPPHGRREWLCEARLDGEVVGFATLIDAGAYLHLEQLSVAPRHGRQGIGRALVAAVFEEAVRGGFAAVTLRTFAQVPWNQTFYERCGFAVVDRAPSAFHEGLEATEHSLGLPSFGSRVHMLAPAVVTQGPSGRRTAG